MPSIWNVSATTAAGEERGDRDHVADGALRPEQPEQAPDDDRQQQEAEQPEHGQPERDLQRDLGAAARPDCVPATTARITSAIVSVSTVAPTVLATIGSLASLASRISG